MYDNLRCLYPLPKVDAVTTGLLFQTKDMPCPWLGLFEIREDGSLWKQAYDVADESDPSAVGFARLTGMMTRTNERWEPFDLTGAVNFYTETVDGWLDFTALFDQGKIVAIVRHENRK